MKKTLVLYGIIGLVFAGCVAKKQPEKDQEVKKEPVVVEEKKAEPVVEKDSKKTYSFYFL